MARSFIGSIALALHDALVPFSENTSTVEAVQSLLRAFGWSVDTVDDASIARIQSAFGVGETFAAAKDLVEQLENAGDKDSLALAGQLTDLLLALVERIRNLANAPPPGLPFPLDQQRFWNEVAPALVDELVAGYLEREWPALYASLLLCGIVEHAYMNPGEPGRVPYRLRRLAWARLATVLSSPATIAKDVYHWNDPATALDQERLLDVAQYLSWKLGIPARRRSPSPALLDRYYSPTNLARSAVQELLVPLARPSVPT